MTITRTMEKMREKVGPPSILHSKLSTEVNYVMLDV